MILSAEISLYPLKDGYIPNIKAFIDKLNRYDELTVQTNGMSTQICGDYDLVMKVLQTEMKATYQQDYKAIFVCKFLNSNIREFSAE